MSERCNRVLDDFYFPGLLKWQTWVISQNQRFARCVEPHFQRLADGLEPHFQEIGPYYRIPQEAPLLGMLPFRHERLKRSLRVMTDWNTPRCFVSANPFVVTNVRCTAFRVPVFCTNTSRFLLSDSSHSASTANIPSQNFISQRLTTLSSRSITKSIWTPRVELSEGYRQAHALQTTPEIPKACLMASMC